MKSMTGIGQAQGQVQGNVLRIEIKSINHRYCEVNCRFPTRYALLEIPIQNLVKNRLNRGRIDIFIFEDKADTLGNLEKAGLKSYCKYINNIKQALNLKEEITLSQVLAGGGSWGGRAVDPNLTWKELEPIIEKALKNVQEMRVSEGSRLKKEIMSRFAEINKIFLSISGQSQNIKEDLEKKMMTRLQERMKEVKEIDPQRMQTEILFYLDRMDISEEIERIQSHMKQTQIFLADPEPVGRKLDFLLQEFNREFNTVASKVQNSQIAHHVVSAKAELEKIREQIQNIE
jgi:uncharacterized protein (TIGR00255 family)